MSAPPSAHSASLRKPYRPLPIALLNRVAPVTPLSAQSLIDKAKRQTGLSDFGDDAFRDPLERLVCAINEEASLTAMGSMIIRGRLTSVFRLMPPGDGSGGLLAAHGPIVVRKQKTGYVIQHYDAPNEDSCFAINLDPNGTSF